jgi:SAM-dependent methyltransferase
MIMTDPEQPDGAQSPANIRTDIPHPARVYDYWLGGKDNFAADREVAEAVRSAVPEIVDTARGNRDFLARVVRFLSDSGIRQFLDVGAGLPTSPNVHEIAPDARVVYVDNDPVVTVHAEALMAKGDSTSVIRADLQDVDAVLGEAGKLLDFSQPVALMFVGVLHHIRDEEDPAGLVARYLTALAPGSYLVLSHGTDEYGPEKMRANSEIAARSGAVFVPRGKAAIERMFNGLAPVDPGLVLVSYWRPEGGQPSHNADRVWAYGGVAPV